ncbi:MAG: AEC family transporter [Alphaproteobacteria bacterium]
MNAVVDVVLPVFGVMLAGYVAGRTRVLRAAASEALNGFVFWFGLPALLFAAMARVPVGEVFHLPFLAAFGGAFAITFVLAMAVGLLFAPADLARQTMQAMAASFANTGYLGLPLYLTAYGQDRALPAVIAAVFNAGIGAAVAIALVEIGRREGGGAKVARDVARSIATNPLLVATVAGLAVSAVGIGLPRPLATFCDLLGAAAGPGALFAIGLFLVGKPIRGGWAELGWATGCKLLLQPAIAAWLAFSVFEMERDWAVAAVVMSALPTGALAFVIARRYDVHVEGTSAAILATHAASFVTLAALLAWLA